MMLVFRIGAYVLSGLGIISVLSGATGPGLFPAGKVLALDPQHSMVFGVCAGFGNYTGIDVTLLRLFWVIAAIYRGIGIGLYVLAFLLMPTPQ